jgi:glyoxylase-like metal-dependent hydrolase (beta-lactamase superfamily II)
MFPKFILNTIFLFSVLTAFSQTDNGLKMNVKTIKVNNKIYMIQAKGGNIGLSFGDDGIFMIDTQYADGIEQIQKEIRKISGKPADSIAVQYLVNTHFHEDHVGGNIAMAKRGTTIFSQENTRLRLEEMLSKDSRKIPEDILPIVTFSEELTFHFNNEKIIVFHVPNAHTDGDAMVYFPKNNVLHAGDVFFNGKYPFIDTEKGGSLKGMVMAMEKAITLINETTKIIPGHGDIGNSNDLQKAADMLTNVYKRVMAQYLNKVSEDNVAKMKDLTKEFDEKGYGTGFITTEAFLRMVYKEVAKEREDPKGNSEKNRQAREKVEQMEKEYNEKMMKREKESKKAGKE